MGTAFHLRDEAKPATNEAGNRDRRVGSLDQSVFCSEGKSLFSHLGDVIIHSEREYAGDRLVWKGKERALVSLACLRLEVVRMDIQAGRSHPLK
jgi:hypothetical protein